VPNITRAGAALAGAVVIVAASACGSSATSSTGGDDPIARQLTATVPSSTGSSSTGSSSTGSSSTGSSSTTRDTSSTETGSSTPDGERPAACDLLTRADVAVAFDEPAVAGDQRTDECWWSSANDLKTVNLIRRTGDVKTWRSGYQNEYWQPNTLGDEGYTGLAFDSVVWRVGEIQYELNVVYSTSGDAAQIATDLAQKVAARI
jgi:hypothetical protein